MRSKKRKYEASGQHRAFLHLYIVDENMDVT